MNNEIDIQLVRDNYARIDNDKLVHIAKNDAKGMTPAAQQIIKDELKKRNLEEGLTRGVEAQNSVLSTQDFDAYCELIRDLDCPLCGSGGRKLNATMTIRVMSFVIITHRRKNILIACPDCLDRAHTHALLTTAILGWWGLPWGVIRTVHAIYQTIRHKKAIHLTAPTEYLKTITADRIGQLAIYKDNRQKLQELIKQPD